ncbi:MAG: hypothetical protein ACYDB1_01650 [Acidiferrobacteraceae bacterium]
MMSLDVTEPAAIKTRLQAYLRVLGVPEELRAVWVKTASQGAAHASQAFIALQALMVNEGAVIGIEAEDEAGRSVLWRLAVWLGQPDPVVADWVVRPPLVRRPMASERKR